MIFRIFLFVGFEQDHLHQCLRECLKGKTLNTVGLISEINIKELDLIYYKQKPLFRNTTFDFIDNTTMPGKDIIKKMSHHESIAIKMMDRNHKYPFKSYDKRKILYMSQLTNAYSLLLNYDYKLILFSIIPHATFNYILFNLAKLLGIQTKFFSQIQVQDIFCISDSISDLHSDLSVESNTNYVLSSNLQSEFKSRSNNEAPFYMSNRGLNLLQILYNLQKRIFRVHTYTQWAYSIKTKLIYIFTKKHSIPINNKYIYFPLHFQPESSTSPQGDIYVDQYLAILTLSKALPEGITILVKEHPKQAIWRRSDGFYSILRKLDNVKFISKKENSHTLIYNSIAVATITGTAGWEAIFNKIPVFAFGKPFYKNMTGVINIQDSTQIKDCIKSILNKTFVLACESDIKSFLYSIQKNYEYGVTDQTYLRQSNLSYRENTSLIIKAIYKAINL